MRPTGVNTQREIRGRVAVSLLETGGDVRQGARHVKASPGSVRRGRDVCVQHAEAGLQAKPHPGGSHPKLTAYQRQQLIDLLRQGACAHGYCSRRPAHLTGHDLFAVYPAMARRSVGSLATQPLWRGSSPASALRRMSVSRRQELSLSLGVSANAKRLSQCVLTSGAVDS